MEFALPHIGEGVNEAELVRWLVAPGDAVRKGQTLLEVLTDKATMEVPSPFAGTIAAVKGEPGQIIPVGQVILEYTLAGQTAPAESAPAEAAAAPLAPAKAAEPVQVAAMNGPALARTPLAVKAAPSVRQMARKLGVDLASITGSGPAGRVLIEDLSRHVVPAGRDLPAPRRPEPAIDYGRPGTHIKLQGLRRRIAERMVQATTTIPHYSYIDECDVSDLVRLRGSLKDAYAAAGVKLTYLPFFVKALVGALKEVPLVNASLEEKDNEIVLHDRYHIGIAVATPGGLIVPVVRDADKKGIGDIARDIERLSGEARLGKAKREDLSGGTFTLTSVGNIGGLISTPVINPPEVGILGIGKVVKRPVFDDNGQVKPADVVYLSFSFDHRVVDGAVGAAFGNAVLRRLSNPAVLLLPESP